MLTSAGNRNKGIICEEQNENKLQLGQNKQKHELYSATRRSCVLYKNKWDLIEWKVAAPV
jgi:hypothetical protein